jgi:hypothetical protein
MPTISNLISRALRKISSDSVGDTINGTEINAVLDELNSMLASWSTENFMPPFRTIENFSLVAGTASYAIGSGAAFNATRPDTINYIYTRDTNNVDLVVNPYTRDEYNSISLKTAQGRPDYFFYDTQYPNGVIYLYPTPDQVYTLYVDSIKPITQITSTSSTLILPGQYEDVIVYNLAVRLAPDYGFPLAEHPEIVNIANESLRKIKALNAKPEKANFDPYLVNKPSQPNQSWNIYNIDT